MKNDLERTQSLFLAAPSVSRRVNKLKVNFVMVNGKCHNSEHHHCEHHKWKHHYGELHHGQLYFSELHHGHCEENQYVNRVFSFILIFNPKVDALLIDSWDKHVAENQKKKS